MRTSSLSSTMNPSTVAPILVLFAAILASCLGVEYARSEFVQGMLRADFTTPYPEKPCDGSRTAACTGCGSIKICVSSDPGMEYLNPRQDCPAASPQCSMSTSLTGAVCQKTPDLSEAECAANSNFKCTGVGFFPDPYSCQAYHYCSGPGATPDDYDCPTGYRFSSKVDACALSVTTCPSFSCKADNVDSVFQSLPADTQYYVYCAYDKTVTPAKLIDTYVFSCGKGAIYNPTTGRCVFTCPRDGMFVNTANPQQYYQCYIMGGRFVYKDLLCSSGMVFDVALKRCIAKAK